MTALRKLSALKVRVIRDGKESIIEARDMVPGDILLLAAGDQVGADARLIEAAALEATEAELTGESLPVVKSTEAVPEDAGLGDRRNMIYSGTHLTAGRGRAVVVATGLQTEVGKIARMTTTAEQPKTPLEVRLKQFLGRVEGRAYAHVRCAVDHPPAGQRGGDGIDAVARAQVVAHGEVGGGKADGAPHLVAVLDHAPDREGPGQQVSGHAAIARLQRLADAAANPSFRAPEHARELACGDALEAVELDQVLLLERKRAEAVEEQAKVLAVAMQTAKINIVGGDGAFFDRFIRAVGTGQAIDGTMDHSETLKKLLGEYFDGSKSLPADLKEVLSRPAVSADGVQKLTVSALLGDLMLSSDGAVKRKLQALLQKAQELGLE